MGKEITALKIKWFACFIREHKDGLLNIKRKDRLEALCHVALIAPAHYMILQIRVRKVSYKNIRREI